MKTKRFNLRASTVVTLNNYTQLIGWPIMATLLGLLLGAVVIVASGENPLSVYAVMLQKSLFSPYYLFSTLTRATPVIICGVAACLCWRAGYINLGLEGQMTLGAIAAVLVGLYCPGPKPLVLVLALLAGMAAGALYALIPTLLQWKCGLSIVICTLMLNYVAKDITNYLASFPFKSATASSTASQTDNISEFLRFPRLLEGQTLNVGFLLALLVVAGALFFCNRTILGYESKMGGLNPSFARYGGTRQVRIMFLTMSMAGAIAALAGISECYGTKYCFVANMFSSASYGWTGLQAALIGQLNPITTLIYAIVLTALDVGGSAIQRSFGVPSQISDLIKCAITLFVSVRLVFNLFRERKSGGDTPKDGAPVSTAEAGQSL